MSFKECPDFKLPERADVKIWRYMDLSKFLSLLDRAALYFVRVDHLSSFDAFEGYYTAANIQFDEISFKDLPDEWKNESGVEDEKIWEILKNEKRKIRHFVKANRAVTFVNSWHVQNHESAAMWRLYLKSDDGLAIQSTVSRLIEAMVKYDEYEVFIGMVKYIDFAKETIPTGNILFPFMHKRKSFEHESELRALIWTPQYGKNKIPPGENKHSADSGIYIPVDLDVLVERIYVAPTAPQWIHDLIRSQVKRFGFDKPVLKSDLAAIPMY